MGVTVTGSSPLVRWRRGLLDLLGAWIRWERDAAGLRDLATHHVYCAALGQKSRFLDAGAHLGEFSNEVVTRFGACGVALEPVAELREKIVPRHGLDVRAGALVGSPAREAEIEIHLSNNPQANSTDPTLAELYGGRGTIRVRAWTLSELVADLLADSAPAAIVDLVKLDIEGAEFDVLETADEATLGRIAQITVEIHDFLGLAEVGARVRAIRRRLEGLGFRAIVLSAPWRNHSDVLFLNRRLLRLRLAERWHLALLVRIALPLRGLIQRFRRGPT